MSETKKIRGDYSVKTIDSAGNIAGNITFSASNISIESTLVLLNSNSGANGQVFTSSGPNASPVWSNASPLTTKGDIYIWDITNDRLPVGADGTYLRANSADPKGLTWASVAGGASPLTTKGDLYTYDTSDARLPVGTDGYVLKANSATTTGLEWAVESGAASPLTTKGDIYIYSTTNDRLPVGTNGFVLTANSATTTGLNWQAPGAGTLQTIWMPATSMKTRTNNGATATTTQTTNNFIMVETYDFDQSTEQFVQFDIAFPKGWNLGNVTAEFYWTADASSGNVVWGLQGVAVSDTDIIDAAFGTGQVILDTLGNTGNLHVTSVTSNITIGGTPATNDLVVFQVYRDAANVSDTLAANARLLGVKVFYTSSTWDDT